MIKTVLVTGDRGYIGAVLVPLLLEKGYEVVGYDVNYFQQTFPRNFQEAEYRKITKDIRDLQKEDLKGIDAIVHLAALSNDPIGELNPYLTEDINYKASVKLATLGKEVGVKRFLFSSSCSVYGGNGDRPVIEEDDVDPLTPYAKSKVETEQAVAKLADSTFSPVFLRNSTVYGYSPKIRLDLVVNNLVAWAITTGKITLLSDGNAWRPLVHVKDLSRVFMQMLEADEMSIKTQVFNVGSDEQNYLIKHIADDIHKQLPTCEVVFGENASPDKRNYKVSFSKLKKTFPDFQFEMNIPKGITELIEKYRQYDLRQEDFESSSYIRLKTIKKLLKEQEIDDQLRYRKS